MDKCKRVGRLRGIMAALSPGPILDRWMTVARPYKLERIPVLTVILLVMSLGCIARASVFPPQFYSAKEIRATVVEEATGHPLEGVVVLAIWELRTISGRGPRLQVSEAITDALGIFLIPSWGPKFRPPMAEFHNKSPLLLFFRHGYVPLQLLNVPKKKVVALYPGYRSMRTKQFLDLMNTHLWFGFEGSPEEPIQESIWNELTIQLEPFRGTSGRWLELLASLVDAIAEDDSKHTRLFFEALNGERQYFASHPVEQRKSISLESLFSRIDRALGK